MLAYAIRRLVQFIPTIFVITGVMFLLLNILPGNAALMGMDQRKAKDPKQIALLEKQWGLDKPIHVRYLNYLTGLVKGDLGKSFLRKEPVTGLLAQRIRPTLELALAAMAVAVGFGLPLGFLSALKKGTVLDTLSMVGAVSGISVPQFWLGILLMFFLSVKIRIFPTSGYGTFMHLVLPAVSLGVGYMALIARTTRAAVIDVLAQDFIRTARSKGLSEILVNSRHVFQNTLILVLTTVGLQFGSLIGTTVVVEKLFSWPGIGTLLVDSIYQRDIPVTQGCILLIIMIFLIVNLVVDLLYAVVDPRITYK